jgi:hypothetical protein
MFWKWRYILKNLEEEIIRLSEEYNLELVKTKIYHFNGKPWIEVIGFVIDEFKINKHTK